MWPWSPMFIPAIEPCACAVAGWRTSISPSATRAVAERRERFTGLLLPPWKGRMKEDVKIAACIGDRDRPSESGRGGWRLFGPRGIGTSNCKRPPPRVRLSLQALPVRCAQRTETVGVGTSFQDNQYLGIDRSIQQM